MDLSSPHNRTFALMKSSVARFGTAAVLLALGGAALAGGLYVGHTDDAPGAGLLGILLMLGSVVLAVRIARR